jgi:hypothetical protein
MSLIAPKWAISPWAGGAAFCIKNGSGSSSKQGPNHKIYIRIYQYRTRNSIENNR